MDAIDRKILNIMQDNASIAIADLARAVGLSPTPCWKRVQKLESAGVILGRVALVDPHKIGLGLTVFVSSFAKYVVPGVKFGVMLPSTTQPWCESNA